MNYYETLHLVKGEDLNHHGTLFAARAAAWLVEAAFAAAACEHGSSDEIVCRNMHEMSFYHPVTKGSVILLMSRVVYAGNTSLVVYVVVRDAMTKEKAADGFVTFVTVDAADGKKIKHRVKLDKPLGEAEEGLRAKALELIGKGLRIKQCEKSKNTDAGIEINTDTKGILKDVECYALDMDGTIYLGDQWIEGAKEFLEALERAGKKYVFLTNNSSKNPGVYAEKLKRMGWETDVSRIITSGQAAIYYLQKHYNKKRVFLLGNHMLREEFLQEGICLDDEDPEIVVTAFDTSLTYEKMCRVCGFVRSGLPYIATHPDYNCPTEDGFIPDAGAIHAYINASAGRYPDRIIGKPNSDMIDYLLIRTGMERERVVMVGDRLYTDIAAGRNNGLKSVLVLSGESSKEDVPASDVKPDIIFDSVKELKDYI